MRYQRAETFFYARIFSNCNRAKEGEQTKQERVARKNSRMENDYSRKSFRTTYFKFSQCVSTRYICFAWVTVLCKIQFSTWIDLFLHFEIQLGQHWNNGNPGVNNNWRERTDIQTEEQTPKGKGGRKGKGKGFNNNGYNSKNSFNSKDSRISRENSKENSKVSEDKPSKEKS